MALEIFSSTGGTASGDGIFIPRSNLVTGGLSADSELDVAVAANIKRDKVAFALARIVDNFLTTLTDKLGVSNSSPNTNSTSWTFALTTQFYENLATTTNMAVLPVPTSGANSGDGDFAFTDIFAGATKVAATDAISGAGVLLLTSDLATYAPIVHAAINLANDARMLVHALYRWMSSSDGLPVRSTTVASAVTGKSISTPSTFSLPANATASTDPTTSISASNLTKLGLLQATESITFNILLSIDGSGNQTWDVNSVTS